MMSEFNKIKIAFALALLGTLYTLNPIVLKYGDISFSFLGYGLKVQMVYFSFLTLLGISVYFYAIALISENKIFIFMQKGGNISYTISLLIPPLYISLYVISIIVEIVSNYANFPTVALLLI
jgi:hypothetical protein